MLHPQTSRAFWVVGPRLAAVRTGGSGARRTGRGREVPAVPLSGDGTGRRGYCPPAFPTNSSPAAASSPPAALWVKPGPQEATARGDWSPRSRPLQPAHGPRPPQGPAESQQPREAAGSSSAAEHRGTCPSRSLRTHKHWRQHFLHDFYFKLQRMLHTLMNLYLNRSARDQG